MKVWGKILRSLLLSILLCIFLTGPANKPAATALYILLMTGFLYGFGSVKDALLGVLAKTGHYSLTALLFRSVAGGIIVLLVSMLALSAVFYVGVIGGYIRMVKDIHLSLTAPRRDAGGYECIDLDTW